MSEQDNIQIVKQLYANFGKGDIPALLAAIDPSVEWSNAGPSSISYARKRQGSAEIREFFETIYATVDVRSFEPQEYVAQGDRVIALGTWIGRVRATDRNFTSDWAMSWTLRDGKVVKFSSYEDTDAVAAEFGV